MCVWVTWCSQKRLSFCKQRTSRIRIVSFSAVAPRPMLMEHMATHGWMACETFRFIKTLKVLLCGVYGLKLHTWDFHRCFLFFFGGVESETESHAWDDGPNCKVSWTADIMGNQLATYDIFGPNWAQFWLKLWLKLCGRMRLALCFALCIFRLLR